MAKKTEEWYPQDEEEGRDREKGGTPYI